MIDKVVDSTALENSLKLVGDAVREKGGTTELLTFPQGFVDAIKAIQAGGGGIAGYDVEQGEFTLTADAKRYRLDGMENYAEGTHDVFIVFVKDFQPSAWAKPNVIGGFACAGVTGNYEASGGAVGRDDDSAMTPRVGVSRGLYGGPPYITVSSSVDYKLVGGVTYKWIYLREKK